jgi:hypothetical protein
MFVRTRRRRLGVTLDLVESSRTTAGPRQRFVLTLGTLHPRRNCHRRLLTQARDRLSSLSLPPPDRARAARALCATLRRLGHVVAHQFEVALAAYAENPKRRLTSLRGCTVGPISHKMAKTMIKRFEWFGTVGRARIFYGLHGPDGDVLGIVGFGHGAHDSGRCGALVLERGFTMLHAPPNAATHLIGRAIRTLRKAGWSKFKAYADVAAGETGAIYRAAGFKLRASTRWPWRYQLQISGKKLSDRAIYRIFGGHAAARAAGAVITKVPARVAWEWCR